MIEAIKPKKNTKIVPKNYIDEARFNQLVTDAYVVMLDYSRIRKKALNKNNPLQIGNVSFWFEVDKKTDQPYLKYNLNVKAWDEVAITRDLEQHFHDLHFNTAQT